uniref:hypothetical protein n=2 Tax=Limosilactobacillus reuteri TaxID=1598 RepID=UPI003D80E2E5
MIMSNNELEEYIRSLLRYTLVNDSDQTNEYDVRVTGNNIYIIPIMPTTFIIDEVLYDKAYNALSIGLAPYLTVIKGLAMEIATFPNQDITQQRGLVFHFYVGQPQRYTCSMTHLIQQYHKSHLIPLMKQMNWDFVRFPGAIVSGNSGSGKSYFLKTLFTVCNVIGETVVIDPKISDLARMTRHRKATKAIIPNFASNARQGIGSHFLSTIVDALKQLEIEIYQRQQLLFENSKKISTDYRELGLKPIFIFIDELAALTTGSNRQIKQDFLDTLTRLAVLGRESGIYLVLSLQSARTDFVSDIVRQQLSLKVLLGRINRQTAQFLFPELSEAPTIPVGKKGTGIVSISGDPRFSGIQPIATPTILED